MKKFVVVIAGPTASGKSGLAINLSKRIPSEIISCDSMQIYQKMDIGTAKATVDERNLVQHHLIDFVDPSEGMDASTYTHLVREKIDHIFSKNKTPILVGGTGLFLEGLMKNYDWGNCKRNDELRKIFSNYVRDNSLSDLYQLLKNKSPNIATLIQPTDEKRIIRALEKLENETKELSPQINDNSIEYLCYGIDLDREKLYAKINQRVDDMVEQGLEHEVRKLYNSGLNENNQSMKGIGYKEFFPYFRNEIPLVEAIEKIKQHTRNYAKRQLTWFRHMQQIKWIAPNDVETIINDLSKEQK